MTNEQAPERNERDVIKPMDKHAPIAAAGIGKNTPAQPATGEAVPAGTVSPQDKRMPLGESR
ncbi:hypothetical protein ABTY53_23210 [Streptomyces noursei]|uniref:hypothetical protein n=1 Tax=Streptomyces noursei TaxID=1971 RepID=UPI00332230C1